MSDSRLQVVGLSQCVCVCVCTDVTCVCVHCSYMFNDVLMNGTALSVDVLIPVDVLIMAVNTRWWICGA